MTSGMSAKDTALGTNAPGNGVPLNRAPAPRSPGTSGNGSARRGRGTRADHDSDEAQTDLGDGIAETTQTAAGSLSASGPFPVLSSSVRMLILGIDYDGRIVQHDRNAAAILARRPDELLGAQLSDLTVGPALGTRTRPGPATALPRSAGCSRRSVPIARAARCSPSRPATAIRPRPW